MKKVTLVKHAPTYKLLTHCSNKIESLDSQEGFVIAVSLIYSAYFAFSHSRFTLNVQSTSSELCKRHANIITVDASYKYR